MSDELARLVDLARRRVMTQEEQERQRRSFAYGNTKAENDDITRESIDSAAEALAANDGKKNNKQ